jgi:pectin methylesterase-like acyl-CoA thioesterase
MKNLISAALVLLLLVSVSGAKVEFNSLQELVDSYNVNIEKAPQFITKILGSETFDFTIPLNNGTTLRWGFEMQDAKIINSSQGGIENPSIVIYATEEAIDNVLAAQDTTAAYRKAEQEGQMKIDGTGRWSKLKVDAARSNPDFIKYLFGIFSQG